MSIALSEANWVQRFATELARLGAPMSARDLRDMAAEIWPFLGELSPEETARFQWGAAGSDTED